MSLILAFVEGVILFAVAGMFFVAGEPSGLPRAGPAILRTLVFAASGLLVFHLNDFYELRRTWGFGPFMRRFPRALAMMFVVGCVIELIVSGPHARWTSLAGAIVAIGLILLPLRFLI